MSVHGTKLPIRDVRRLVAIEGKRSGRALQVDFAELAVSGLASMYPAFDWGVLRSWPSWVSARVRSHYEIGLNRASWVTSVRKRREDRTSISSHPLADLGG